MTTESPRAAAKEEKAAPAWQVEVTKARAAPSSSRSQRRGRLATGLSVFGFDHAAPADMKPATQRKAGKIKYGFMTSRAALERGGLICRSRDTTGSRMPNRGETPGVTGLAESAGDQPNS
jgi:hypothetical protein